MALQTYPQSPKQRVEQGQKKNYSFRTDDEIASTDRFGRPINNTASTPEQRAEGERLAREFGLLGGSPSSGPNSNFVAPFSTLVAGISEKISQSTNEGQAALQNQVSPQAKEQLDKLSAELSGDIGSGLNGMSGGSRFDGNSAMGINNVVQSTVGGAIDTLKSVAGSTSNIAADISGSIGKLTGGNLAGGLMKAAGGISAAAGMLNNLLSLKRGVNIPKGAEVFATQGQAIQLQPGSKDDWRVRITCNWNIFNSAMFDRLKDTGGVVWPYLPNITVSTKAEYNAVNPVHSNYTQYNYKNSVVEDIQISGDFSCETETDAAYWIAATTFFKTATKMFFGQGDNAGNPPIVCNLTGYGASVFDRTPIIIKSFSVDLKDDVNYILCDTYGTRTWVPVLSTISVTVAPVYSREMLRKFDIQDYARGRLAEANGEGNVGYI
jgi:hypothetical protein